MNSSRFFTASCDPLPVASTDRCHWRPARDPADDEMPDTVRGDRQIVAVFSPSLPGTTHVLADEIVPHTKDAFMLRALLREEPAIAA